MDMQNVAKLDIPEGEVRTIHDKDGNLIWGKVSYGVKYKGDTAQNGTPTPDAPVAVQTVTGENTLTISDGTNTQSYEVNLGKNLLEMPIESGSSNGITWTVQDDGSIILNGTSTAGVNIRANNVTIPAVEGETYTLSATGMGEAYNFGYKNSGSGENIFVVTSASPTTTAVVTSTMLSQANRLDMYIRSGKTFNNQRVTLQLEKGSQATTYAAYFEPIELCKIGDYQDYIYRSGGKWYIHKEVGKATYNGSENWGYESQTYYLDGFNGKPYSSFSQTTPQAVSPHFKWGGGSAGTFNFGDFWYTLAGTRLRLEKDENPNSTTLAAFKTWLGSNNLSVYYVLATPADTEITNEALVAQLEAVEQWLTRYGYNATVSGNLPIIIDRTAL